MTARRKPRSTLILGGGGFGLDEYGEWIVRGRRIWFVDPARDQVDELEALPWRWLAHAAVILVAMALGIASAVVAH